MANLISPSENCPLSCVAYLIAITLQKYNHLSLNERWKLSYLYKLTIKKAKAVIPPSNLLLCPYP